MAPYLARKCPCRQSEGGTVTTVTQQLPESKVDSEIAMDPSELSTSEPEADAEIRPSRAVA